MDINNKLEKLYAEKWSDLMGALTSSEKADYTSPFLICVDEDAWNLADLKVMIFGQETKGWWEHKGLPLSSTEAVYRYRYSYIETKIYDRYKSGVFFKGFNFFRKSLIKSPLIVGKKTCFAWNNIAKVGKSESKTGVCNFTRAIERKYFPVIAKELEITKPNIVIFMTGPNRDHDLRFHFPDIKFSQANTVDSIRQMAIVEFSGFKGIRLYHPNYYSGFDNKYKKRALETLESMVLDLK